MSDSDEALELSREIARKHEAAQRKQARGDYEAIQRAKASWVNAPQPPPSKVHRNWPCPVCGLSPDEVCACEEFGLQPAPQPPPSVPAGAEVAEVLAGLVEEIREDWQRSNIRFTWQRSGGLYDALIRVEEAQRAAATGARAVGGDVDAAAKSLVEWLGQPWDDYSGEDRDNAREAVRIVLAAAPPTPAAHGVAELLAEARRRLAKGNRTMPCTEIVYLLAPGGADGAGTKTVTEWQVWIEGRDKPLVTNKWGWVRKWNDHSPGAIVRLCRREVTTRTTPWEDVAIPVPSGADGTEAGT